LNNIPLEAVYMTWLEGGLLEDGELIMGLDEASEIEGIDPRS